MVQWCLLLKSSFFFNLFYSFKNKYRCSFFVFPNWNPVPPFKAFTYLLYPCPVLQVWFHCMFMDHYKVLLMHLFSYYFTIILLSLFLIFLSYWIENNWKIENTFSFLVGLQQFTWNSMEYIYIYVAWYIYMSYFFLLYIYQSFLLSNSLNIILSCILLGRTLLLPNVSQETFCEMAGRKA